MLQAEQPEILVSDADGATVTTPLLTTIQGGRERGLVLHKLIEEVLTGGDKITGADSLIALAQFRTFEFGEAAPGLDCHQLLGGQPAYPGPSLGK